MGLFDFFKRKVETPTQNTRREVSVFDEEDYIFSKEEFLSQKASYESLNDLQKASIIVTMEGFREMYFQDETYQREIVESLIKHREEMMGMSYDKAQSFISSAGNIMNGLSSIENRKILNYQLADMKYMLKVLVSLTIRYNNGAEVNRHAIDTLYGIFVPQGYDKLKVYNPRDFMMF